MAPAGIAVVLAGLLSLELHLAAEPLDAGARQPAWSASQRPLRARNASAPKPTVSALREIILSRPLFDPTRRPAVLIQQPAAPVQTPRLSGIIVTPTEKIAVFSPAKGAPIVVDQNSRFGPFTVLAISGDSVTMKGPAGVTVLRSEFSDLGQPEIATANSTILADGVYLNLIKITLPKALHWPGSPLVR